MTTPGLKAIWQRLELYASQRPLSARRCRECGRESTSTSLCASCEDRRIELRAQFHMFRVPSDVVETDDELQARRRGEPSQPRMQLSTPREWFPYKDPDD